MYLNNIESRLTTLLRIKQRFKQKKELEREQKGSEVPRIENLDDRNTQQVQKSLFYKYN